MLFFQLPNNKKKKQSKTKCTIIDCDRYKSIVQTKWIMKINILNDSFQHFSLISNCLVSKNGKLIKKRVEKQRKKKNIELYLSTIYV